MGYITDTILDAIDSGESTHKFVEMKGGVPETRTILLTRDDAIEIVENELIGMSDFGVIEKYGTIQ